MLTSNNPCAARHRDIQIELPHMDGLLAGTMALMTGYAEHQCDLGNAERRKQMAKKIATNLTELAMHPCMTVTLAMVMRNLQAHWHTLTSLDALEAMQVQNKSKLRHSASAEPSAQAVWHPEHSSVQ